MHTHMLCTHTHTHAQVTETGQNTYGMGPVTATTIGDVDEQMASDIAAGAYGRPQPRAEKK